LDSDSTLEKEDFFSPNEREAVVDGVKGKFVKDSWNNEYVFEAYEDQDDEDEEESDNSALDKVERREFTFSEFRRLFEKDGLSLDDHVKRLVEKYSTQNIKVKPLHRKLLTDYYTRYPIKDDPGQDKVMLDKGYNQIKKFHLGDVLMKKAYLKDGNISQKKEQPQNNVNMKRNYSSESYLESLANKIVIGTFSVGLAGALILGASYNVYDSLKEQPVEEQGVAKHNTNAEVNKDYLMYCWNEGGKIFTSDSPRENSNSKVFNGNLEDCLVNNFIPLNPKQKDTLYYKRLKDGTLVLSNRP
jgi:hypothetical protein